MPIEVFDHYTVRCADLDASTRFYRDVLGMRAEPHDGLAFRIVMMFVGDQAIAHLLETGAALDEFFGHAAPAHGGGVERQTGNFQHVAFNATGLDDLRARLGAAGIEFSEKTLPEFGLHQVFVDDPDGVEIEINYPIAEKTG